MTRQHSFVIGGNSFKEWFDKPGVETGPCIDDHKELPPTTAESCNTHNMLKLTARLFEREPRAEYADYFERALYNHLLATVAPDTGAVTYFTPLRGNFRTYLDGTFCCVGSGIENTPRYNEGIYFQQDSSLWVNLLHSVRTRLARTRGLVAPSGRRHHEGETGALHRREERGQIRHVELPHAALDFRPGGSDAERQGKGARGQAVHLCLAETKMEDR